MENKRVLTGIPVMVLIFGLVFAGCDNGNTSLKKGSDDTTEKDNPTKFEGNWSFVPNIDGTTGFASFTF
jgi:hypothetical protein